MKILSLAVLVVDDLDDDFEFTKLVLKASFAPLHAERVERSEDLAEALARRPWDIVLCDIAMPKMDHVDAFRIVQERAPNLPIIMVTGSIGEDAVAQLMRAGARDVVLKRNIRSRLSLTLDREVALARGREDERKRRRWLDLVLAPSAHSPQWQGTLSAVLGSGPIMG